MIEKVEAGMPVCVYMNICVDVHKCISCMNEYVSVNLYTQGMSVDTVFERKKANMHVNIYIYIYIYIEKTYVATYIHMHTHQLHQVQKIQ